MRHLSWRRRLSNRERESESYMAFCTICGDPCGLVKSHPECDTRISLGVPPEKVRADVKLAQGATLNAKLYSSTSSVSVLAMIVFPILIIAGAVEGYPLFGTSDPSSSSFFAGVGALVGGLIAALVYSWLRMQALLARRIAEYLDSH
jgi:hypothetical protein